MRLNILYGAVYMQIADMLRILCAVFRQIMRQTGEKPEQRRLCKKIQLQSVLSASKNLLHNGKQHLSAVCIRTEGQFPV